MGGNPAARGSSNADQRGNSEYRRKRKQLLLERDGDGTYAPCWECGDVLDFHTATVDCIVPRCQGGTYGTLKDLSNVRLHCHPCSRSQGGKLGTAIRMARRRAA